MKLTNVQCDICGASKIYDPQFKEDLELAVIFITEQTEGRPSDPYLSKSRLDICCDCYGNILHGNYVFAKGAQGCNIYFFKRNDVLNNEILGVNNGK